MRFCLVLGVFFLPLIFSEPEPEERAATRDVFTTKTTGRVKLTCKFTIVYTGTTANTRASNAINCVPKPKKTTRGVSSLLLGYEFTTYGWDVLSVTAGNPEERADPMNMVFPKVTKCTFHKYGPSGTITTHDGLCIL